MNKKRDIFDIVVFFATWQNTQFKRNDMCAAIQQLKDLSINEAKSLG